MDRSTVAAVATIRESLRSNAMFSGVPDDVLDQIAALVADSTTQKIVQSLRKVPLFEGLSLEDVLRLQQVADTVALAPGEILFEEGKKGDTFYVVLGGRVELFKRGRDGAEQKLAIAREGEAFGEMALLNQSPRSATARALEQTSLLEISRQDFDSLLGADSFAVRMLRGISKALWAMSVRFASNSGRDARDAIRALGQVMRKSMLPSGAPRIPGYSVMATTASSDKAAGESAWDWFRLGDGRIVFTVMRARGDGLPAAFSLVLARTLLREIGKDQSDPGKLLARVNEALLGARVAGAHQDVECALVAVKDGELTWAAAGPVAATVVRANGSREELPAGALALGASSGADYQAIEVAVQAGDSLLTVAAAVTDALARGTEVAGAMVEAGAREIARKVASDLPADDPVSGDVFENTVLVLKRGEQVEAPREVGDERAAGNGSLDETPRLQPMRRSALGL